MNNPWDNKTLTARIANDKDRFRYPAGSPDINEITAYETALSDLHAYEHACVLGMTPELRNLAARRFNQLTSVDNNPNAIATFRNWLEPTLKERENICKTDWFDFLIEHVDCFDTIFGDGIFGNLQNEAAHQELLYLIANSLKSTGIFVTRMALIPNNFQPKHSDWRTLRARFRAKEIDESEFGFGVRLLGHYNCCYDPFTSKLDNEKLFRECQQAFYSGEITQEEHTAIFRYYFGGTNCIVSQHQWESIIQGCGGYFKIQRCNGKEWYGYYPVYHIEFNKVTLKNLTL